MSWLVIGIGNSDPQLGCEYELPDEEFGTDEAIEWLGSRARLSGALWPLDRQHLPDAERLIGEPLDAERMDLFVIRKPQWYVTARAGGEAPLTIEYHLPEEFGFTQAAAWLGGWALDMAYTSTELSAERGTEIEEKYGTLAAPGRYRHVLRSTASAD